MKNNKFDYFYSSTKVLLGISTAIEPKIGLLSPILTEIVGLTTPNQRIDRIEELLLDTIKRLDKLERFSSKENQKIQQSFIKLLNETKNKFNNMENNEDADINFNNILNEKYEYKGLYDHEYIKLIKVTCCTSKYLGSCEIKLKLINKAITLSGDIIDPNLCFYAGIYYNCLNKYLMAIGAYMCSIEKGDINPSLCLLNIGNNFKNLEIYDYALKAYEKSVEINPKQLLSWLNAGEILKLAGHEKKAKKYLLKYIECIENNKITETSKYYNKYDLEEAKKFCKIG